MAGGRGSVLTDGQQADGHGGDAESRELHACEALGQQRGSEQDGATHRSRASPIRVREPA